MKQPIPFILISFSVSALLFSCKGKEQDVVTASGKVCISDSMEKIITIDSAYSGKIDDELKLSGEISFSDNNVVKVFPFSSGKVLDVKVSMADKVVKGQVLATISSADVAGNYSDLSTANNDINIAKKQMENEESLYKNGIASEREYTEAKENYLKAATSAKKLNRQLEINGGGHTTAAGSYSVTAPISGYVVEKKISEGGFIRGDNGDNMFTIGDISEVWVWANVYESDISRVKEGYHAIVTTLAYPGKEFPGIVDKVNQILDPVTKVMKIRVKLKNEAGLLKPEMFANILITNKGSEQSVSIPDKAIVSENGKDYVILYKGKCDLKVVEVEVFKKVSGLAYIRSGIQAGDKVVSSNQILLFRALTEQ